MFKISATALVAALIAAVKAADIENLDQVQVEQDPSYQKIYEAEKARADRAKAEVFLQIFDLNNDGKLSISEILTDPMFRSSLDDELTKMASAKSWISSLDRDGDGELNLDEIANFNQKVDQKEDQSRNIDMLFASIDTDGDGYITLGEMMARPPIVKIQGDYSDEEYEQAV